MIYPAIIPGMRQLKKGWARVALEHLCADGFSEEEIKYMRRGYEAA